eukprot:g8076.t1
MHRILSVCSRRCLSGMIGMRSSCNSAEIESVCSKSVYMENYGCQMNVNDSEVVLSILRSAGYHQTRVLDEADVILLNTCAIREKPESKIWRRLEQIRHSQKNEGKKSVIGVLGCMAERVKDRLLDREKLADLVVGPDAYRDLPNLLTKLNEDPQEGRVNVALSLEETYADITPLRPRGKVSAFLTIIRGCNNLCSFCIVPYTRGRERSRPMQSILDEVKLLRDQGVKDITLLGQNVNSYSDASNIQHKPHHQMNTSNKDAFAIYAKGFTSIYKPRREGAKSFADLLNAVANVDDEIRIRFTSPHPKDFNDDVIEVWPSPLPSRFSKETEEEHEATLDLMRRIKFDQAFMFKYSEREKTHAYRHWPDDVSRETKQRRLQEVINVFREGLHERNQAEIGKRHLVLVEEDSMKDSSSLTGRSDNFKRVVFPKMAIPNLLKSENSMVVPQIGDYVLVEVTSATHGTLQAKPINITSLELSQNHLAFDLSSMLQKKVCFTPIPADEFRTSGSCKTARSFLGVYYNTYLELKDSYLMISFDQSKHKDFKWNLNLTDTSLIVLTGTKFTISSSNWSYWFKFNNGLQCSQWLNTFQRIPGLQRRIDDFYEIGKECGIGSSCVVYECYSKLTGNRFALKERINLHDELSLIGLYNELRILQVMEKNQHSTILRLNDYFVNKGDLQLILEFIPGGELGSKIDREGPLKECDAIEVFKRVTEGVRHLHENCIGHRDLKLSNIMLTWTPLDPMGGPKIIDYDLALLNHSKNWFGANLCGTPEFMAPEIYQGESYTLKVDIWSLGCVLYEMLIGHNPFKGENKQITKSNVLSCKLDYQGLEKVSIEAKDLILKMLEPNPENRFTAQQVLDHPWITSHT